MVIPEVHVGDKGTIFELTVKDEQGAIVGLSQATTLLMKFRKPTGELVIREALLSTDGTDGKMRYTTTEGSPPGSPGSPPADTDLDVPGVWRVQGYVELPSGNWHTTTHRVRVYPNVDYSI